MLEHIENAYATPPHLEVLLRLGGSRLLHGSLRLGCAVCFRLLNVSPLSSLFTVGGPSSHIDASFLVNFDGAFAVGRNTGHEMRLASVRNCAHFRITFAFAKPYISS